MPAVRRARVRSRTLTDRPPHHRTQRPTPNPDPDGLTAALCCCPVCLLCVSVCAHPAAGRLGALSGRWRDPPVLPVPCRAVPCCLCCAALCGAVRCGARGGLVVGLYVGRRGRRACGITHSGWLLCSFLCGILTDSHSQTHSTQKPRGKFPTQRVLACFLVLPPSRVGGLAALVWRRA